MIDITEFNKALSKRVMTGKIDCIYSTNNYDYNKLHIYSKIVFPHSVNYYFENYIPVDILCNNRGLRLLPPMELELIDEKFLLFAKINNIENICFDTSNINFASEWDIVNYSNNYLITKTISSFLSNKVWAWIERGRKIWDQE
ncbi:MAG: hypothetical protein VB102_07460 [Paludibacter sp.]|nr:hypothetical protein [Paludibacter sp.]